VVVAVLLIVAGCCPLNDKKKTTPVDPIGGGTGSGSGAGSGSDALVWSPNVDWTKPPEPGPEPSFVPPVPEAFALANGVKVLLVENHRLPLVSIRIVLPHAGSRQDPSTIRTGLAAITGDMLDEGAGTLTSTTLPEELERLGAELDVSVGADSATVSLDTLLETLPDSIALLGDVLIRPQMTAADFARVRGDRIAELALRPDSPRKVATLVFEQAVFGSHPYGKPGDGYVNTINRISLPDVKTFWKIAYVPDGATVVIAGDVTRASITPLLDKALGAWKGKAPQATAAPKPPAPTEPRLVVVDRPDAPQSVVVLGRLGPDTTDPAHFPAEVINLATGGSFASRLNNRLREQLGYTYGISSSFWRGRWAGSWSVMSSLKTANTIDGIKEILKILDAVRTEPLPAAELAKAKQLMTRALPQDFETNGSIVGAYRDVVVQGRPLTWYTTVADGVRKVTAAEARAVADAAWKGLTIVVVGDWKVLGPGLAGLGLPIEHQDAEGRPTKR
jgi:predicted Zn-dependent peptidase